MSLYTVFADGEAQVQAPVQGQAQVQVPAPAPEQQSQQQAPSGGGFLGMMPMLIILAVFMFFIFRSQKKQQQKRQEMIDKLTKGTQVVYGGGIVGKIVEIRADRCIVENFDGSRNEVLTNGIAEIVPAAAAAPGT